MKRFLKTIGAVVGLGVLLLLAAFIAAAWYIRQPVMIENIRQRSAQAIGGDVVIGDLDLKLFKGITLEKLKIYAEPVAVPGEEFFEVRSIDLRYIPWKFFRRTIEFKNVLLQQPHLILRQARDGSWRMPRMNLQNLTEQLTFQTGILRFIILMDDFEVQRGQMTFLSDGGKTLFEATGMGLKGNLAFEPGTTSADGTVQIRQMLLAQTLQVDSLSSPIKIDNRTILLPELAADIHGGRLGGSLEADLAAQVPTFKANLNLTSVQLSSLLREFKAREGLLAGQLDLRTQLNGTLREPNLVQGTGEFDIRNARLSGLGVSGAVAELLRIPELATQSFPKVNGTFKIADEQITFYRLEAVSPRMQATASGMIGLQRKLDFDVQLALSPDLMEALPAEIRKRLNLRPDGFGTVTFKVDGTLDDPRSNLAEKITGQP